MPRMIALLMLVFISYSCNYRVYTNGKYNHKAKGLTANWRSSNNECIFLDSNQNIPDSSTFLNDTKILSPLVWLTMQSPNKLMINRTEDEAERIGANIIKVTDKGATKLTRYRYIAKMYYLPEPYLTAYRRSEDSLIQVNKRINKDFCIVHLKSYSCKWDEGPIYLNDSLVGYCHGAKKIKGGFDIHRLDLKLDKKGILSPKNTGTNRYILGVSLEKGEEYYINIIPGRAGPAFQTVEKIDF
jgi:hypothetical protein